MTKEQDLKLILESYKFTVKEAEFLTALKNDVEACKKFLLYAVPKLPKGPGSGSFSCFAKFHSANMFGGEKLLKNAADSNEDLAKQIEDGKVDDKTLYPLCGAVLGWLEDDEGEQLLAAYDKEQKNQQKEEPAEESIEASTVAQPPKGDTLQVGQTGDPAELATPVLDSEEPVPPGTQNPQPLPEPDLAMDFDNDIMYSDLDEIIPGTSLPNPIDSDAEDEVTPLAFDRPL